MIDSRVREFRDEYRRVYIPRGYRGWMHLVFTFGVGGTAFACCLLQLQAIRPLEWLTIPITFLYANLAEYWGHRGPMHHLKKGLRLIYERHTRQHHRFFTDEAMPLDEWRDLRAVLFPPLLMTFFITAFALPAWLLLAVIASPNVAWLFVATALGYFLNYEFLHLAYHLPEGHAISRLPLVGRLKRLHQTHHDQRVMASCNFNITYPVGDVLFGTLRK